MLIHPTNDGILAFSTTSDGKVEYAFPSDVQMIVPHQTHGVNTLVVDEDFLNLNAVERVTRLTGVDALCTDLPGVIVTVKTADCIPVFIYDDVKRVVSAVHAGWRGTQQRIVKANIQVLMEHYGCKPEHLHAIIGPGISMDSFEVGDEVYNAFSTADFPMERIARRYPSSRGDGERWHIDLWEANRMQLQYMGVSDSNIFVSGICTVKSSDRFYSARAHGSRTGRIYNGICLKLQQL